MIKKTFVFMVWFLLTLQVASCGKKSNPVVRDDDGKVIEGNSFPPPYGAQIQE